MTRPIPAILTVATALCLLAACQSEPKPHRYLEVAFREKGGATEAPIRLSWTLPEGWVEQNGGDPLRVAGFFAPDPALAHMGDMDPKAADVSVVQLAGDAGGLQANITRWLGQIKVISTPAQVERWIAAADTLSAATGQKGIALDFTGLLASDMTESRSILGAVIQGGNYTVFVKAMGERDRLTKIKPQWTAFCRSLRIEELAP